MKKMLMGIFLLILSVWCYNFGVVDDVVVFSFLGVFLPIPAIIIFLLGFFNRNEKN
ncbi:hypothetical protein [Acidaminobacterium chupaoyuni]